MNLSRLITSKNKYIILFAGFLFVFLFCCIRNQQVFYYDANAYWMYGDSFWNNGFSLFNYPQVIRGYLLPLILGISQNWGAAIFHSEVFLFWIIYSCMAVVLTMVLIPKLIGAELWTRRHLVCGWGILAGFLFFLEDYITFPLSDLPALTFYTAIIILLKNFAFQKESTRKSALLQGFLAGVFTYASYNVRTVYLYPMILLWVIFGIYCVWKKRKKLFLMLIAALLGGLLVAAPQMIINYGHYNVPSPKVFTLIDGNNDLFIMQLKWGIHFPRYETYAGDLSIYPSPGVYFTNPLGLKLLENASIASVKDYVIWLFTHFIDAIGLYTEHLISGITIFWREAYITDITVDTTAFLLNCAVYILALLGIISGEKKVNKAFVIQTFIPMCIALLPALMAMLGALEVRFFLCIYLMVYAYICLKLDYKGLFKYVQAHYIQTAVIVIAVFFVWCMTANNLLAILQYGEVLLSGNILS